jgi:LAS superfamily LD-carboxypeptidase LdcB
MGASDVALLSDAEVWDRIEGAVLQPLGQLVIGKTIASVEPKCGVGRVKNLHAPKETVELEGMNQPGKPKRVLLEKRTAAAYRVLVDHAHRSGFAEPLFAIVSGYRDDSKQAAIFDRALAKYHSVSEARKWVAPPGHSAHATGCAIDFWFGFPCGKEFNAQIKRTAAYNWMVDNAKKHGFNPYVLEGWHWEYNVGEPY